MLDNVFVWRNGEGCPTVATLKTATYVFMVMSCNEYPPAGPHRQAALVADGRGILLGKQF